MFVWELAAKIYYTDATSEQIAKFMEAQENKWKERVQKRVDWSKIKNRDIDETEDKKS